MINLTKLINLNSFNQSNSIRHLINVQPLTFFNRRRINSVKRIDVDLFSKLDNNIRKNGRVGEKTFYRYFDHLISSPNISRDESLLLIRSCGSYFIQLSSKERNKLSDKVWSFLINKKITLDQSHYNALLNVYLENNYPFDPQKFMDEMINAGIELNRVTYQRLMHRYCNLGDIEGAAKILELMKSKGMTINESVFHSLLIGYSRANDLDAAYNVLNMMTQNGLEPNKDTYKILLCEYAFHLNETGIIAKIEATLREASQKEVMWTFSDYFEIIKAIAQNDEKSVIIDDLLANIKKSYGYNLECMNAVIELIHEHKLDAALKLFYTSRPSEMLKESKTQGMYVIDHLIRADFPMEKVIEVCEKFISSGINDYAYSKAAESALVHCDLEKAKFYLKKFCDTSGTTQIHYFWPLLCKCKSEDEMFTILKESIAPLALITSYSAMIETFRDYIWPKITSNLISFFKKCKELGFSEKLLLTALIEQKFKHRTNLDNFKLIKPSDLMRSEGSRKDLEHEIFLFLDELVSESKDIQLVKDIFDLLINQTGVKVSNVILGPRIRVHLINNDLEGAIEEFIYCATKYRFGPWRIPLMQRLIEKEDTENLQKITDLCGSIYGEQNILIDLSIAFMSCDRDKQAKKILLTPGLRVAQNRINRIMSKMLKDNDTKILEKFVSMTKDLFEVNRDDQYFYLLKAYIKEENVNKALEVWTLMQEENLSPSPKILRHLAHFLQLKNVKIPFEISEEEMYGNENDERERYTLAKEEIIRYLKDNQIEKALSVKADFEASGFKLNLIDKCNIIEILTKNNELNEAISMINELISDGSYPSPRIFKLLLNELSKLGRYEDIENLRNKLPSAIENTTWFSNLVVNSYINSGQSNEFLIKTLHELKPFPIGSLLPLLSQRPEIEKLLHNLAEQMAKSSSYTLPLNMIWIHLMLNERYEEAENVFNSNPKFKESLLFNPLLEKIKADKKVDLGLKLIKFINETNMSPRTIGIVYSGVIDTLIENENLDQAENLLISGIENSKAKEKPMNESDFNQNTLLRLYHNIKNKCNRLPKFEIPEKPSKISEDTHSSLALEEDDVVGQTVNSQFSNP